MADFYNDAEKMADFHKLTKTQFLISYSYLTEDEYEATNKKFAAEYFPELEAYLNYY